MRRMVWAALTVVVWGAFTAGDAGAAAAHEKQLTKAEVVRALATALPQPRTDTVSTVVIAAVSGTGRHGHRLTDDCVTTRSLAARHTEHRYDVTVRALRDAGWHPVRHTSPEGRRTTVLKKGGWTLTVESSPDHVDRDADLISVIGISASC